MNFFSPLFLFHHFSSLFLTILLNFKVVAFLFFEVVCVQVDSELESNALHLLLHLRVSIFKIMMMTIFFISQILYLILFH
jgi:hypothetical protein